MSSKYQYARADYMKPQLKRVRYGGGILIEHLDRSGTFALPGARKGEKNVATYEELKARAFAAGIKCELVR